MSITNNIKTGTNVITSNLKSTFVAISRPTTVSLDNATINENNQVGDLIGNFTFDGTLPVTVQAVAEAPNDNTAFTFSGNQLTAAEVFDYEDDTQKTIKVKAVNAAGESDTITLNIDITDVPDVVPVANNVAIDDTTPTVGQQLTGSYVYNANEGGAEATSTFRWLRDDVPISGATSINYTPVAGDAGSVLKFEVTPVGTVLSGSAAQSAGTSSVAGGIVLDTVTETFDKDEFITQERVPNGKFEQGVFYDSDRTYVSFGAPWNTFYRSLGGLHYYDANDGYYPARIDTTEWQSEANNHLTTTVHINSTHIYIFQEDRHKLNFECWRSPKNAYNFEKFDTHTTPGVARNHIYQIDDSNFMLFVQESGGSGTDYCGLIPFNTTTGFGTYKRLMEAAAVNLRNYPIKPYGINRDSNNDYHLICVSATSTGFEEYFEVITQDFDTFRNRQNTFTFQLSVDGAVDPADLRTNGARIYGEETPTENLVDFLPAINSSGDIFGLSFEDTANEIKKVFGVGNAAYSESIVSTFPDTIVGNDTITDGSAIQWVADQDGVKYAVIRVLKSTYYKFHLYKSTDDFVTWEDLGDLTPGINQNIHRCSGPQNYNAIDQSKNFVFYSCQYLYDGVTGVLGQMYACKAAFNSIKTESPTSYTDTLTAITDISWDFAFESDDVTESSGVITQLDDKTGNGRHATANGGEAVIQDGAIKTYGIGGFDLASFGDFDTDTGFTFVTVAKKVGEAYLLTMGDESSQFNHVGLKINSDGSIGYEIQRTSVDIETIKSTANIKGDQYFIAVVWSNGKHLRVRVNGQETNKIWGGDDPVAQAFDWFNEYNTALDNLTIGYRKNSVLEGSPTDFKALAYKNSVITFDEIRQLENFLANKYSITLGDFGTAPTLEPEVSITVARMTTAPSASEQTAINDLIVDIKNDNSLPLGESSLGDMRDVYYILAGHSNSESLLNFARPRFDATGVNSPTFTADNGFKSDGTSSYINTNFNPSKHSRWNSSEWGGACYVTEDFTGANKAAFGLRNGSQNTIRIFPKNASNQATLNIGTSSALTISSVTDGRAFLAIYRDGTTRTAQRETSTTSGVTSAQAFVDGDIYILASNASGPLFYLDANVSIVSFGNADIDHTDLRTAERTFLTGKGITGI